MNFANALLLKNAKIVGENSHKDIFMAGGKIVAIDTGIDTGNIPCKKVDAEGQTVIPGLVDSHVHFLGAADKEGYNTKTPEIYVSHFFKHGVTTAVGVLGFGSIVEGVQRLYVKAHTLHEEGLSAYIFTGNFQIPPPTITGSVKEDIVMLPRVLGVKTSIADTSSSHPTPREFARLASDAYTAGQESGKSGLLHTHVGFNGDPFAFLEETMAISKIPFEQFVPTHCNWSKDLLEGSIAYALKGGYVDFSTILSFKRGSQTSISASNSILKLLDAGVPTDKISMSSDGNVGMSIRDEQRVKHGIYVQRVNSLFEEVAALVKKGVALEIAVKLASENPAKRIGLFPKKGAISVGSDADIVLLDDDLTIRYVCARGRECVIDTEPVVFSRFERELETYTPDSKYHG